MPESEKAASNETSYVVKKGERIPRKPQGEYAEAESLKHAISRDGFLGTAMDDNCLLYTSPSPRDATLSRMPSSA